jgi:hypothetical protein
MPVYLVPNVLTCGPTKPVISSPSFWIFGFFSLRNSSFASWSAVVCGNVAIGHACWFWLGGGGGLSRRKQVIACGLWWKHSCCLWEGGGGSELLASSYFCFMQVAFCTNTDRHLVNIRRTVKMFYCKEVKTQVWNEKGQILDNYLGLCLFTGMYCGRGMPAEFPASLVPHSLIYNWFLVSVHQADLLESRGASCTSIPLSAFSVLCFLLPFIKTLSQNLQ